MPSYNKKVDLVCPCGKTFQAWSHNIRLRGHSGKCRGCRRREIIKHKVPPYATLFNHMKFVAGKRKIEFRLTFEEFLCFTHVPLCFYCETPLVWRAYVTRGQSAACNLDRKDSNGAYEKENLVCCCGICNRLKSDRFTFEQMCSLAPTLKILSQKITSFKEN